MKKRDLKNKRDLENRRDIRRIAGLVVLLFILSLFWFNLYDVVVLLQPTETTPSVYLSWDDNSIDELGFKVERSTSSDFSLNLVEVCHVPTDVTFCVDEGVVSPLVPGYTYFYRVYSYNLQGNSAYAIPVVPPGGSITIPNPLQINSVTPGIVLNTEETLITITGTGFDPANARIRINFPGIGELQISPNAGGSSTELTFAMPDVCSAVCWAGVANLYVDNNPINNPYVDISNLFDFMITSPPAQINLVNPPTSPNGGSIVVTLIGDNFLQRVENPNPAVTEPVFEGSSLFWTYAGTTYLPLFQIPGIFDYISGDLRLTLPIGTPAGTYDLQISNPDYDTDPNNDPISNVVSFIVTQAITCPVAPPVVNSILPSSTVPNRGTQGFQLIGSGFTADSTVMFGITDLGSAFIDENTLGFAFPAEGAPPFVANLHVLDTASGCISDFFDLTITSESPVINSIIPSSVAQGGSVEITGTGFYAPIGGDGTQNIYGTTSLVGYGFGQGGQVTYFVGTDYTINLETSINLNIPSGMATGSYDIYVKNPVDGSFDSYLLDITPQIGCVLTSATWNPTEVNVGESSTMKVAGNLGCNGEGVVFKIYNGNTNALVSESSPVTIAGGEASLVWMTPVSGFGLGIGIIIPLILQGSLIGFVALFGRKKKDMKNQNLVLILIIVLIAVVIFNFSGNVSLQPVSDSYYFRAVPVNSGISAIQSGSLTVNALAGAPVITGVTPGEIYNNFQNTLTISGTDFGANPIVHVVLAGNDNVYAHEFVDGNLRITSQAYPFEGTATIYIDNAGQISNGFNISVLEPFPEISYVSPLGVEAGLPFDLEIFAGSSETGFSYSSVLQFSVDGISWGDITAVAGGSSLVWNPTKLVITMQNGIPSGDYNLRVVNLDSKVSNEKTIIGSASCTGISACLSVGVCSAGAVSCSGIGLGGVGSEVGTWQCSYPASYQLNTELSCSDGLDNDCDGFTDSLDPDCDIPGAPANPPGNGGGGGGGGGGSASYACNDDRDNDGDGYCDFNGAVAGVNGCNGLPDSGCVSNTDNNEVNDLPVGDGGDSGVPECSDLKDNDGDGFSDMADAGCTDPDDDSEINELINIGEEPSSLPKKDYVSGESIRIGIFWIISAILLVAIVILVILIVKVLKRRATFIELARASGVLNQDRVIYKTK